MHTKLTLVVFLAALLVASFASASVAAPEAEAQSAAGKITAVGASSFTLEVKGDSVEFATDANTEIEGKLEVGAQANVTYRSEGGKNIAIRVKVEAEA
jgi:hypothetical protein